MKISTFGLFLCIAVASAQLADPTTFFAQILRVQGTGAFTPIVFGTMITERHALTAAFEVFGIEADNLRILAGSITFNTGQDIRRVTEVFIHPNFNNVSRVNNIAVIEGDYSPLNIINVVPRYLHELSVTQCRIFGFIQWSPIFTPFPINVTNVGCDSNAHFCGSFPLAAFQCNGYIGSGVICESQDHVHGIVSTDLICQAGTATAQFLNIAPYSEWIWEVSSAKINAQISLAVMALGLVLGKFVF